MANKRWFRVVNDPDILDDCRLRHESQGRGNLSVRLRNDGVEAVVKVDGADKTWRRQRTWLDHEVGVWDEDDHDNLKALMRTPAWADDPSEGP